MKYLLYTLTLVLFTHYLQAQQQCCYDNVWQSGVFQIQEDPLFSTDCYNTSTLNTPLVADINQDGISEIVTTDLDAPTGTQYQTNNILITNQLNPCNPGVIPFQSDNINLGAMAIGNILTGAAYPGLEIVAVNRQNELYIIHSISGINTGLINSSMIRVGQIPSQGRIPLLADLDNDGVSEIYIDKYVFYQASPTNWVRVDAPTTNNGSRRYITNGSTITVGGPPYEFANPVTNNSRTKYQLPLAIDIIPTNPNKEIIIGNEIFNYTQSGITKVGDANNATNKSLYGIKNLQDGYVSTGNVDADANIEIVVNGTVELDNGNIQFGIYVYDPITNLLDGYIPSMSTQGNGWNTGSAITLANIDVSVPGAELVWLETNRLMVYNITLPGNSFWNAPLVISDGSGMTGVVAFDFNGDGEDELVYRDEQNVRIMNGNMNPPLTGLGSVANGRNWYVQSCLSGTGSENPVIADFDYDGEAEIITIGGKPGVIYPNSNIGDIKVFESQVLPWNQTVTYWNQKQYYYVNAKTPTFNTPLTLPNLQIPRFQTSQLLTVAGQTPYNLFLGQPSVLRDSIQYYPDLNIKVLSKDCKEIKIEVCNRCPETAPVGIPIRSFDQSPMTASATIRGVYSTPNDLDQGQCLTMTIPTNYNTGDWFFLVNDNGATSPPYLLSPPSDYENEDFRECSYDDNITYAQIECQNWSPNCCQTDLAIWNPDDGQQHPSPVQTTVVNGIDLSYSEEIFEIHQDASVPITELRVNLQDIEFQYNYEQCAECVNNPAVWGSIFSSGNTIGTAPSVLTQKPPFTLGSFANNITDGKNTREVLWENPNGAMLKSGDNFKVGYILPPPSDIPCCATKVRICSKISWKDANCNICEIYTCSDIDLSNKITSLNIDSEAKGCCERNLTANSDEPATYLWNTGETTKSIVVSQNGTYSVTATSGSNSLTQFITVNNILKGNFPTLDFTPLATPNLGNNFTIYDYTKPNGASYAYNATKYTLWIFNSDDTGIAQNKNPDDGAFRKIVGYADCGEGFKNGDIQWDGRDDYGNKVQGDAYNFILRLENCNNKNECLSYSSYLAGTTPGCGKRKNKEWCRNDCATCTHERVIPFLGWPKYWKCTAGFGIRNNRIRHLNLQW